MSRLKRLFVMRSIVGARTILVVGLGGGRAFVAVGFAAAL